MSRNDREICEWDWAGDTDAPLDGRPIVVTHRPSGVTLTIPCQGRATLTRAVAFGVRDRLDEFLEEFDLTPDPECG